MIRGYQPGKRLELESTDSVQWSAALTSGLIAGLILLFVPRGSPITFFLRVIMGRALPVNVALALPVVWMIHLALSLIYGVVISLFVAHPSQGRATVMGGIVGVLLYLLNLGIVSLCFPEWRGNEVPVLFTHIVFGLIAGSAYRGLLRRKVAV